MFCAKEEKGMSKKTRINGLKRDVGRPLNLKRENF
jgi:hypothetical protein